MAETVTSKQLIMGFLSDLGNSKKLTVKNAAEGLDAEQVAAYMDTIIEKSVFQYADGDPLTIAESASVRTVSELPLF